MLSPLLGYRMLDHHLATHLSHEFFDKPRIPEFGGDAQVLAAPHHRVRFTSFCGRRDTFRVEVLLFAAGDAD